MARSLDARRGVLESARQPRTGTGVAQEGMDWPGVRLLHDHIIAKPAGKTNRKIPWHQDSMFWPVDLPGCSTWTPMEDVGVTGGCLEVIDASHLEGCEQPVDFMAEERWEFGDEAERVLLPVKAGSTVLLHSLTWHRSVQTQPILIVLFTSDCGFILLLDGDQIS